MPKPATTAAPATAPKPVCPHLATGAAPFKNLGDHVAVPLSGCFAYHAQNMVTVVNSLNGKQTYDTEPEGAVHADGSFAFTDAFGTGQGQVCGQPARVVATEGWYDSTQPGVLQTQAASVTFTVTCDHS